MDQTQPQEPETDEIKRMVVVTDSLEDDRMFSAFALYTFRLNGVPDKVMSQTDFERWTPEQAHKAATEAGFLVVILPGNRPIPAQIPAALIGASQAKVPWMVLTTMEDFIIRMKSANPADNTTTIEGLPILMDLVTYKPTDITEQYVKTVMRALGPSGIEGTGP
jgi:hypothetical protein